MEKLSVKFKEKLNQLNDNSITLANLGWFLPPTAGLEFSMAVLKGADLGLKNLIDKSMISFYKKNLNLFKQHLIDKHSQRKGIINEAFECHRKKLYFASTILFLSQADGICYGNLFTSKKIKKYIEKNNITGLFKTIFNEELIINVGTDAREKKFRDSTDINRHGIMHGFDYNFNNEKNSLQALSLLLFADGFKK